MVIYFEKQVWTKHTFYNFFIVGRGIKPKKKKVLKSGDRTKLNINNIPNFCNKIEEESEEDESDEEESNEEEIEEEEREDVEEKEPITRDDLIAKLKSLMSDQEAEEKKANGEFTESDSE